MGINSHNNTTVIPIIVEVLGMKPKIIERVLGKLDNTGKV